MAVKVFANIWLVNVYEGEKEAGENAYIQLRVVIRVDLKSYYGLAQ